MNLIKINLNLILLVLSLPICLLAASLNETDRINYFNKHFPQPKCKVSNTDKIVLVNSIIKCLVINNGKVDYRMSCDPAKSKFDFSQAVERHCNKNMDDFTNQTPVH